MNPTLTKEQTAAAQNVGASFGVGTLSPEQQAAVLKVQSAFTPPKSADQVNNMGSVNMPSGTPPTGNISNAQASTSAATTYYDTKIKQSEADAKAAADAETKRVAAEKVQSEQTKPFLDKILGSKSPTEVRSEATTTTGVNPTEYFANERSKIAEIETLTESYNKAVADRDAQIVAAQGQLATNGYISKDVARIERNFAPRLNEISANVNAKSATLKALQGSFQEAQSFINQAVEDATAETRYNLQMFESFYSLNQKTIDSLDDKYKSAITASRQEADEAYKVQYEEKKQIGNLLLDNPQAGIDIYHDTFDEALAKVSANPNSPANLYKQAQINAENALAENRGKNTPTTPPVKFTNSQINKGSINAGLQLEQFKSLDPDVQNFFVNLNKAQTDWYAKTLASVRSGETSIDSVNSELDTLAISEPAKNYLKQQIASIAPAAKQEDTRGFFGKTWDWLTNLF